MYCRTLKCFSYNSKGLDIEYCNIKLGFSIFKKDIIRIKSYEDVVNDFKPSVIHSHLYFSEIVTHQLPRKKYKIYNTFPW